MASTDGYNFFGGKVDDYVRLANTDELIPDAPLTITDPSNEATLTDLLDAGGSPVEAISADSDGEFAFWARPAVVQYTTPGANTYTAIATSALIAAAGTGNLAELVQQAQAAAASAANSASSAESDAENSVPKSYLGTQVPTLDQSGDNAGRLSASYMDSTTLDRIAALEGQVGGVVGPTQFNWEFEVADPENAGANSFVAGFQGHFARSDYVLTFQYGLKVFIDQPGTTDTVIDLYSNASGTYASMGTQWTIPAGSTDTGVNTAPPASVFLLPPGTKFKPVIVSAPAPGVPSTTQATLPTTGTDTDIVNTGSGTGNFTIPMPTAANGAVTGDGVYVVLANAGNATLSLPAPWSLKSDHQSATPKIRMQEWFAPWISGLTCVVTNGGIGCGIAQLCHNPNLTTPLPQVIPLDGEGVGASFATGSGTADQGYDIVLYACAVFYQNTGLVGEVIGTPSGITKLGSQNITSRSGASNLELFLGQKTSLIGAGVGAAPALAAGGSMPSVTFTVTDTSGTLAADTVETAVSGIPRASATTGPSRCWIGAEPLASQVAAS